MSRALVFGFAGSALILIATAPSLALAQSVEWIRQFGSDSSD
ncbi:unnamed protein product, partial [marine sediment metagenome]